MALQFVVVTLTGGAYTNQTNKLLYLYGNATVTSIKGAAAPGATQPTALTTSLPMWLPPGWTVNGSSGTLIAAIQGDTIEDFRGFLSNGAAQSAAPVSPTYTVIGTSGVSKAITSTTPVMFGFGSASSPAVYTPTKTGNLTVTFYGQWADTMASNLAQLDGVLYGTGTAPANGAAETGTKAKGTPTAYVWTTPVAGGELPLQIVCYITGLTLGTQIWLDLGGAVGAGGSTFTIQGNFAIREDGN